ncbi:hypothetical protein BC832DRAFT_258564 [Gaertneriomyces semiglobifer]|nr:hypothetical protein BC832DRAFT_258564 [Gaertneriomyces semiglobifer]
MLILFFALDRSPSTITTISSYLSGISSYVSSHSPSSPLINQQEATARGPEKVICVKFCRVDWWGTSRARLCLLLGYARGFQVWVVDDIEDVREVISVRDGLGSVKWLDAVPNPKSVKEAKDYLEASRPVMAYITNANPATARPDNPASPSQSALQIYSLRSQAVVQTIRFSDDVAMDAKCNDRVIVVAMRSNTLQLYSALTLHQLAVYTDVASPIVFDIGSQFLIYATTTAVPPTRANSEDDESDEDAYNDMTQGLARQVAGKVAKELVGGAKVLGEMSARAISNYFGKEGNGAGTKKDVKMERRPSSGGAVGVVVRRFPSPTVHSSSTSQDIAHAHWRPHNNPVSIITFDTSQALILTASTQANTFYIWALPGVPRQGTPRTVVKCLYKLELLPPNVGQRMSIELISVTSRRRRL